MNAKKELAYENGIDWIAFNDEPKEYDLKIVEASISVTLLAVVFEVKPTQVARDVLALRTRANDYYAFP